MNKRAILVPVIVVLAIVSGFAAITLRPDRPKPGATDLAAPDRTARNAPVQQDLSTGKQSVEPTEARNEARNDAKSDKPGAAKDKPADKPKSGKQDTAKQDGQGWSRSEFRRHFEGKMQLMRTASLIGLLERDEKHALTPAQAKLVLKILTPLRSKPKLSNEEAAAVADRLNKVLTSAQHEALAEMRAGSRTGQRPDGQRQVPPSGMVGQRPPQGTPPPGQDGVRREGSPSGTSGERRVVRNSSAEQMKDYNPFYTEGSPDSEMLRTRARHMEAFFAALEKKAK